jgi:hypothetical protein
MKQLIADKEVYRIWYEFYKFALHSTDKTIVSKLKQSRKVYKDWGADLDLHFDDWWTGHSHLFEREDVAVRVLDPGTRVPRSELVIAIPQDARLVDALKQVKALLMDAGVGGGAAAKKSCNPYQPTELQGLKRDALGLMVDLQKHVFNDPKLKGAALRERVHQFFSGERYKKKENKIPFSFMVGSSWDHVEHADAADRNIRRYRQKIKQLILNVADGEFPGKY